jgi:hypothetical protein
MFCPSCGVEEKNRTQFCRGCGAELRLVRAALQQPDASSLTAITAREEITRAIAGKIKELEDADDLKKVAEDILPQVEKFLESPQERRLRRIRAGVVTSAIGLGAAVFFLLGSIVFREDNLVAMVGLGVTLFLIGLGIVINGKFFSQVPGTAVSNTRDDFRQMMPDQQANPTVRPKLDLPVSNDPVPIGSVVEHTTKHLSMDPVMAERPRNTRE